MKKFLPYLCFIICFYSFSFEKHALIIAVGDYPTYSGYQKLHSENDAILLKKTLLTIGFKESNITVLLNENADKTGILKAFEKILSLIKPDDILFLHFSGHGQQVQDTNNDEADYLDEAFVPFGTLLNESSSYKGENHLIDDEVGFWIHEFRLKLGKNGHLFFLIDTCFSGSINRGENLISRGGYPHVKISKPSNSKTLHTTNTLNSNLSNYVTISASKGNELAYEYNEFGALTYAFTETLKSLNGSINISYGFLIERIRETIRKISPKQTPLLIGNEETIFLKNFDHESYLHYPFYQKKLENTYLIPAGSLNGINEHTDVEIINSNPKNQPETIKVNLDEINLVSSTFSHKNELNTKDLIVRVSKDNLFKKLNKVFIDSSAQSVINIVTLGKKIPTLNFVNDRFNADFIIKKNNNHLQLHYLKSNKTSFLPIKNNANIISFLKTQIVNYNKAIAFIEVPNSLKKDSLLKIKLLKKEISLNNILDLQNKATVTPDFNYELEIINLSLSPIYLQIFEIDSNYNIKRLVPNVDYNDYYSLQETFVEKNKSFILPLSFSPPFENITLKVIGLSEPISIPLSNNMSRGTKVSSNSFHNVLEHVNTLNLSIKKVE
ncbi:putative Peptidase C14 [Tenacibaculum sediminilitoris]|uniref:caspase family protein n=1 Tax=Tenacibaculum sediminilitoris TaxID=1820334 RepID=UPI003892FB06